MPLTHLLAKVQRALEDVREAFATAHLAAGGKAPPFLQRLRVALPHLRREQPLPRAVVDFEQADVLDERHRGVVTGDRLGGLAGTLERARVDCVDLLPLQAVAQRVSLPQTL